MIDCTTATGPLAPRLMHLASATGTLSPASVKMVGGMLAELAEQMNREAAYRTLTAALDPKGTLSRWGLSQAIAERMKRFGPVAYRRILAGDRPVNSAVEAALVELCGQCGPDSARRIWDELGELGLTVPRQK